METETSGTLVAMLFDLLWLRSMGSMTTEYRITAKETKQIHRIKNRVMVQPYIVEYYSGTKLIESFNVANKILAYWTRNTLVQNSGYRFNGFKIKQIK